MDSDTRKSKIMAMEQKSGWWLARANALIEKGRKEAAEAAYQKSAEWLMKANDLLEKAT